MLNVKQLSGLQPQLRLLFFTADGRRVIDFENDLIISERCSAEVNVDVQMNMRLRLNSYTESLLWTLSAEPPRRCVPRLCGGGGGGVMGEAGGERAVC